MITANDLKDIDRFLDERGKVRYPHDTKAIKRHLIN